MRFRLFRRRYPLSSRRLTVRRFFPRPLRWLLIVLLIGVIGFAGVASRWGSDMMQRFGKQEQSQAELARLQHEMLNLQHQLQAQTPALEVPQEQTPSTASSSEMSDDTTAALAPDPIEEQRSPATGATGLVPVDALKLVNDTTMDALLQQVKELQVDNQRLKNELAFYENLLPAEDNGGISIRSLNVERRSADELSWQLLLMQLKRNATPFKGEVEWQVVGTLDGKPWRLPVKDRRQAITLETYQRLDGQVRIPAALQLSSLTMVVWEGKQERARQSVAFDTE